MEWPTEFGTSCDISQHSALVMTTCSPSGAKGTVALQALQGDGNRCWSRTEDQLSQQRQLDPNLEGSK
jgi:hypothetical protein